MDPLVLCCDTSCLRDPDLFRRCYDALPQPRRSKADSFMFDRDRRLSVGAWTLLRIGLYEIGIDADRYRITVSDGGKPHLDGSGVEFSISHSGERACCIISDHDVGCDVQSTGEVTGGIADAVLTDGEREWCACSDSPPEALCRMWTLKESFLKTIGTGLGASMKSVRISLDGSASLEQDICRGRFYVKEYGMDDGYCCSCCSVCDDLPDSMEHVDLGDSRPHRM